MGLIAPIAAAIALGLVEYIGLIEQNMRLTNAARAGIEYAATFPSDLAGIEQAVGQSGEIETGDLTLSLGQFCECPDGTPVNCADTCSGGVQNNIFLRLDLSQPGRSLLSATGLMSGYTATARAILRMR